MGPDTDQIDQLFFHFVLFFLFFIGDLDYMHLVFDLADFKSIQHDDKSTDAYKNRVNTVVQHLDQVQR